MISGNLSKRSMKRRKPKIPDKEPRGQDLCRISIKEIWENLTIPQVWRILRGFAIILVISFGAGSWQAKTNLQIRINLLEAENEFFEKVTYDKCLTKIEAQEQLFEREIKSKDQEIAVLKRTNLIEQAKIRNLEKQLLNIQSLQKTSIGYRRK